ncbi:uncharacterized protein LOC134823012 [Bolinopsis microptera]|uniref:uncharacterized protein LOC134823012 n=1 Tax=Bolinopsis microptera TaxID=2820187 RepID=UPI0030791515
MYVLTSSPYVSNLFAKQKSELNFDSNEDFILFLLRNTCKLASFANQLSPVLNKLLDYSITDVNSPCPSKTPSECSTKSPSRYNPPSSPQQPTASSADIQQILDTVNRNKKVTTESRERNTDELDRNPHEPEKEESDHKEADEESNLDKRERFHSDSSISENEGMDTSSDSEDLPEPQIASFQSPSEKNSTSKEEPARSSHHQDSPPRRDSSEGSPQTSYQPPISPDSKEGEEEEERMLFDPADLMQKSTAALQVSDEVMKPHSSLKPLPPNSSLPAEPPVEIRPSSTQTQRLVLPRQSSPFKSGHLIAVPLAIGNDMKGIPLPPIHPTSHPGPGYSTTISQPTRPPPVSTSTPKPPVKDTEQNRENLNVTNEMESDNPDKLYICPICNKEFKGSGRVRNCKIHINTVHLKHKPYKCNFCNVRFGYKDYMKRHLIRHHKSLFYSYGTESVLEKYTTYDLEDPGQPQEHDSIHEGRDQRDTTGL